MGLKTKYKDIDNKNNSITIRNSGNESINIGAINKYYNNRAIKIHV